MKGSMCSHKLVYVKFTQCELIRTCLNKKVQANSFIKAPAIQQKPASTATVVAAAVAATAD